MSAVKGKGSTRRSMSEWPRFTVRDFTFDEKAMAAERDRIRELETERQKLYANLIRWLKINFSEIYSASLHIKALRVFVESVLRYVAYLSRLVILLSRYGLPVNFEAMIIHPTTRKSTKRLRDVLDQLFGYLDQSNKAQNDEVEARDFLPILGRSLPFSSKSTFRVCSPRNKNTTHTSTSKWIWILSIRTRNRSLASSILVLSEAKTIFQGVFISLLTQLT